MSELSNVLEEWFDLNGRDLPWRHTRNPYKIWISEIILQQTRVNQGMGYYQRFIERFPDVKSLATADSDEVMKYWEGLGYYSRARNLHEAAHMIVKLGHFPTTYVGVRALKGVGDYTAAAICSVAYGLPHAVVDGNVYRVLSRWMGIDTPIDTTAGKRLFARLADELLDRDNPGLYNQAIMDFGALQCVARSPDCQGCPLSDTCVAYARGQVERFPVKVKRVNLTERYMHYFVLRSGNMVGIRKRTSNDIWRHLYEFALIETDGPTSLEQLLTDGKVAQLYPGNKVPEIRVVVQNVVHQLTHRLIHASIYTLDFDDYIGLTEDYEWVELDELDKFAFPRLLSQFFYLLLSHQ